MLTRHGDEFVSLDDRVRLAREASAALLISIHADMLAGAPADVSGATVYTCSERASDAEAARIAERENAADKAAGVEAKAQAPGVADILFDLERRETRAYAHIFSRGLVGELQGATRLNHNPERSAGFVVLKAPDFPSVLVELGYLSNPKDVQSLNSPEWRARTASAMVERGRSLFRPQRRGVGRRGRRCRCVRQTARRRSRPSAPATGRAAPAVIGRAHAGRGIILPPHSRPTEADGADRRPHVPDNGRALG